MNDTPTTDEQRAHFHTLLAQFNTAMLVTHDLRGSLHARPMAVAHIEDDCTLWFITSIETPKTQEIETDSSVLVVCQNDRSAYLSLCGKARLVREQAMINDLWLESFKVWFPNGKDDPNIVLIQVHPEQGEFWDNQGLNKVQYLFQTAKAFVSGTTPVVKEGEQHGSVRL